MLLLSVGAYLCCCCRWKLTCVVVVGGSLPVLLLSAGLWLALCCCWLSTVMWLLDVVEIVGEDPEVLSRESADSGGLLGEEASVISGSD